MKLHFVFYYALIFLAGFNTTFASERNDQFVDLLSTGQTRLVSAFNLSDSTEDRYRKVLSIGTGIGNLTTRSGYKTAIPPFGLSIDRVSFEDLFDVDWFTSGGYVGYARYKWDYLGFLLEEETINVSEITLASRWGVSINRMLSDLISKKLPDNLELYANLQIGYTIISVESDIVGVIGSGVHIGLLAGARLSLKKFGVFAELGKTEAGFLKGGIAFRF